MLERRGVLRDEIRTILNKAESEKRSLNQEERTALDEKRNELDVLEARLAIEPNPTPNSKPQQATQEAEVPSLLRFFREVASGNLSDASKRLHDAGVEEFRGTGMSVLGKSFAIPSGTKRSLTVAATHDNTVQNELLEVLAPLRNQLVFGQVGATIMTGLVGDVTIPRYSGTTSSWKGETAKAANGEGQIESTTFKPKRLTTVLEVSEQFLLQDSIGAEEMLRSDILNSILVKLEATALGKDDATADQPAGLFAGTIADKGAVSLKRVVGMEGKIDVANALIGNLAYITNAKGRMYLKTTYKGTQEVSGLLSDGKELNNYKLLTTNGVATDLNTNEEGLIFANWNDFVVCQWGGMTVKVDDATKADEGLVRFIINTYWDYGFRRPESYAVASIKG